MADDQFTALHSVPYHTKNQERGTQSGQHTAALTAWARCPWESRTKKSQTLNLCMISSNHLLKLGGYWQEEHVHPTGSTVWRVRITFTNSQPSSRNYAWCLGSMLCNEENIWGRICFCETGEGSLSLGFYMRALHWWRWAVIHSCLCLCSSIQCYIWNDVNAH